MWAYVSKEKSFFPPLDKAQNHSTTPNVMNAVFALSQCLISPALLQQVEYRNLKYLLIPDLGDMHKYTVEQSLDSKQYT